MSHKRPQPEVAGEPAFFEPAAWLRAAFAGG